MTDRAIRKALRAEARQHKWTNPIAGDYVLHILPLDNPPSEHSKRILVGSMLARARTEAREWLEAHGRDPWTGGAR